MTPASTPPRPRLLEGNGDLPADAVRLMLTAPSRDGLLELLGIRDEDARDLAPLADAAAADPEILEEITRVANLLRATAGLDAEGVDLGAMKDRHDELQQRLAPGEGLVPILAFLVSTDTVRAWHALRGLTLEQSWHVLADLGQQMRVHRVGAGCLGLHQLHWVAGNWAGGLVHLGRLQFDLSRHRISRLEGEDASAVAEGTAPRRWVLGTHIPATGPLDPAAVEQSFAAATRYVQENYSDLDQGRSPEEPRFGQEFICESWLISEDLAEITGPESNLARFAGLWDRIGAERMDDGAAFFVFGVRPPYVPAKLPRRTRLEKGVAERLEDGRGWTGGTGRLLR